MLSQVDDPAEMEDAMIESDHSDPGLGDTSESVMRGEAQETTIEYGEAEYIQEERRVLQTDVFYCYPCGRATKETPPPRQKPGPRAGAHIYLYIRRPARPELF